MRGGRFLALFFPDFPLQHLARERPGLATGATVIESGDAGGGRVCAMSASAADAGIRVGWSIPQARARLPGVRCHARDSGGEERALEAVAEALGWVSPRIAWAGEDGLLLEITGTAHLHGGEEELEGRLWTCLEEQEVHARGAVADRSMTAWVLARHGGRTFAIGAPGEDRASLAPLPIAALDPEGTIAAALAAVGMGALGSVASLERSEMARRFGERGIRLHQQARGEWHETLNWRRPRVPLRERMDLPHPCWELSGLVFALQSLLLRLEGRMRGRGVAVVEWSLALEMDVGEDHAERFHMGSPLQSASGLLAMARHRLQAVRLAEPVVALVVWTLRTQPFEGIQEDLLDGSAAAREPLNALLSRLSAELGEGAVHSLQPVGRHRPEGAVKCAAFEPGHRPQPSDLPRGARPTRLLHPPEPLELIREAQAVIWRGRRERFVELGASERIAGEWWEAPFHRDYHVMRMEEGGRWWIYRDLRGGAWRLHGFFE